MKLIFKLAFSRCIGAITKLATNGPRLVQQLMAFGMWSINDRQTIKTSKGEIRIGVSNPLERWRAETLFSKEPETIDWLNRTITPGSVLYDVGANIGLYSIYAAHLFPGSVQVYSFEPEPLNSARLNLNIASNNMSKRILAFPIGLGAINQFGVLRLSSLEAGKALHGERMVLPGEEAHQAGMITQTLDQLLTTTSVFQWPTHLKIDVDGPELEVLSGASKTLENPQLRHLLIEFEEKDIGVAESQLSNKGFKLVRFGSSVCGVVNVIFERH